MSESARPITRSGEIAVGGDAQELAPARANRKGLCVQNRSDGSLYVNDLAEAAADENSVEIPAGALYEYPYGPIGAVSIFGATDGQSFYAREW